MRMKVSIATLLFICCQPIHAEQKTSGKTGLELPPDDKAVPTLDRNRDGLLSRGEANNFDALARRFTSLDNNGDQNLDFRELSRFESSDLR